ncbi:UNVERIFIED_CONTAM: NADH dehydrogenase [ubiquinone] 1 alpha subcomplex subunit-B [Sesamum calycinum]|uniref:NADH dehydrogenase [ubiquinone] 1 alpha subcomplex subunit-B n=1 Tax=Sesamum calycinum TaxID=2727403 RepID=A0AAW2RRQ1_9LAMI
MASAVDAAAGESIPTSSVLMAAAKHIGTKCRGENVAFLKCKKDDPNPEKCLDKGRQVTQLALAFHLQIGMNKDFIALDIYLSVYRAFLVYFMPWPEQTTFIKRRLPGHLRSTFFMPPPKTYAGPPYLLNICFLDIVVCSTLSQVYSRAFLEFCGLSFSLQLFHLLLLPLAQPSHERYGNKELGDGPLPLPRHCPVIENVKLAEGWLTLKAVPTKDIRFRQFSSTSSCAFMAEFSTHIAYTPEGLGDFCSYEKVDDMKLELSRNSALTTQAFL